MVTVKVSEQEVAGSENDTTTLTGEIESGVLVLDMKTFGVVVTVEGQDIEFESTLLLGMALFKSS